MSASRPLRKYLFTCGNGENGRLGLGSNISASLFSLCVGLGDFSISSVSCGTAHTAVATSCGTVFTFGNNQENQLGHYSDYTEAHAPCAVDLPTSVREVAAGYSHTLALTDDGDVYAWGNNTRGQAGNSGQSFITSPFKIPGLPHMRAISAGADHSLALSSDNEVFAWGSNDYGQVGIPKEGRSFFSGSENSGPRMLRALAGSARIESISAGSYHSLAVDDCGGAFGWGANKWWQLGVYNNDNVREPQPIDTGSALSGISGGAYHSLGVAMDGALSTWGTDFHGTLTKDIRDPARVPERVGSVYLKTVTSGWKSCAGVTPHGNLLTWGWSGAYAESPGLDELHGISQSGSHLGHGNQKHVNNPKPVTTIAVPEPSADFDPSNPSEWTHLDQNAGGYQRWRADSVACGLDHMAVVITLNDESEESDTDT